MVRRMVLGLLAAVLLFAAWAIVARVWLHGPVSAGALAVSLDRSIGTGGMGEAGGCTRAAQERVWTCSVSSPEQSGGARYRVTTEPNGSCWTAELIDDDSETRDMPRRPRDCVRLWQWTGFDLLG